MAENTAMRNNALPYAVYGVPWVQVVGILDADGDPVTSAADLDSEISKNGDTMADGGTEAEIGNGLYSVALTGTNTTADVLAGLLKTSTAGAKNTAWVIYPRKLVALATGTSQGGDTGYITLAAGAITFNGQFNGCLCVATIDSNVEARILQACTASNQQCTVTPAWNVAPDADDTYIIYLPEGMQIPQTNTVAISNDLAAADNLESACDNYSATRGLAGTALPAAAADAAGGLAISDAGGLDLDAKLANTNEVTAARMGALTDWINGGRLDLLLDAVATGTKLLKYVQLLARKDAAIGTDNATELTAINANGGSGAGDFSNQTDALQNLKDTALTEAQALAQVAAALNTAVPGSPTANSINERIVSIDTETRGGHTGA